jgi:CRP/FNR family transcriptional regulator, cyclic AMP receptor protein
MDYTGCRITITRVTNCLCFQRDAAFSCSGKAVLVPADTRFCVGFAEGLIPALAAAVYSPEDAMEFECTGGFAGCGGQMTFRISKDIKAKEKPAGARPGKNFAAISKLLLNLPMFKSFDQESINELLSHFHFEHIHDLGFKSHRSRDIIIVKGQPGHHLYIIVAGRVEVVDDHDNIISYLSSGEVFGEMSLISGNPVGATIRAAAPTTVFRLDSKDFKRILSKFPALQSYFTTLLTQRLAQSNVERSIDLSAGMAGKLSDLPPEEVLQTLHINQKTGALNLKLAAGDAAVYFRDGEIIHAAFGDKTDIDAVAEIVECRTGKFNFTPKLPVEFQDMEPLGSFMGILMNALKDMDEKGA